MAKIAVVGGGLAGLACAWRLRRAGHLVRVLERAPAVGGRARSQHQGAFVLDTGTPVVTAGQRRILALARELGVYGRLRPWGFGRDLCWKDGELAPLPKPNFDLARDLRGTLPREALRAALDLQRAGRVFDPNGDASADAARRGAAADELCWWPDGLEAWDAATSAAFQALRGALPQTAPCSFVGGVGALAEALAKRLEVRTDCDVQRVETDSEGATLEFVAGDRERRQRADAVVVATPATRVATLCPKITPEERGFFESTRSKPGAVVHLLFEQAPRWLSLRSVYFGPDSGLEVRSLLCEHVKPGVAPHAGGALRVELTAGAAARMHRASDASVADLVLENLAYSPVGALRPDAFVVSRHADTAPCFDAGHCRRLARFARRLERSPRLAFAGDFLAGPSADGAVASGLRAASEIGLALGAD